MMNAAVKIADAKPAASLQDFRECATDYASYYRSGLLEKAVAVDCAQRHAELWGVVDLYGQDAVQAEMAIAFMDADTADRRARGDAALKTNRNPAAPTDAKLKSLDNSESGDLQAVQPSTYRTPQATIDAFLHKARTENAEQVANWLELHPRDVSTLRKVWKEKCQIR
jgi:hypothetical protein